MLDEDPQLMERRIQIAKRLELYISARDDIDAVCWNSENQGENIEVGIKTVDWANIKGDPVTARSSASFDDPSGQESWLVEEKLWPKYGGDQAVDGEDLRGKEEPFGDDNWSEKAMNNGD
ncbi:hypothetical protein Gogos_006572 [Gossypium gossypioides]|uniref:Uncharacterized protein n=1 Tax=Gossypium gossypioides TaxID=34282 RepID=A0A7J9C614_GOSGO|nr:hypothetical protein [Gossypium gossypioides]